MLRHKLFSRDLVSLENHKATLEPAVVHSVPGAYELRVSGTALPGVSRESGDTQAALLDPGR